MAVDVLARGIGPEALGDLGGERGGAALLSHAGVVRTPPDHPLGGARLREIEVRDVEHDGSRSDLLGEGREARVGLIDGVRGRVERVRGPPARDLRRFARGELLPRQARVALDAVFESQPVGRRQQPREMRQPVSLIFFVAALFK